LGVLLEQVRSAIPSQRATARIPKDEFIESRWRVLEKLAECCCGFWPDRTEPLLATLAEYANLTRALKVEVSQAQRQCFADAGTGVVEEQEQRAITEAIRRLWIDSGDHGAGLLWLEVRGGTNDRTLRGSRQDSPVLLGSRDIVPQQVIDEAANGREAAVARHHAVAPRRLDVIQERKNRLHTDVVEPKIGNRATRLLREEAEEQCQRIPVRPDGVFARPAHSTEVLVEESLHQGEELISLRPGHAPRRSVVR
jgi:hypothetical protein